MVQPNYRERIPGIKTQRARVSNRNRKENPETVGDMIPGYTGNETFNLVYIYIISRRKKMGKYYYPAIFEIEEDGKIFIDFPDLPNCTQAETIKEGLKMAKDSLELQLYSHEVDGIDIPEPSDIMEVEEPKNGFKTYIEADTEHYREFFKSNKAIVKAVSIPEWLSKAAQSRGVSFSAVLQEALKEKVGIN